MQMSQMIKEIREMAIDIGYIFIGYVLSSDPSTCFLSLTLDYSYAFHLGPILNDWTRQFGTHERDPK